MALNFLKFLFRVIALNFFLTILTWPAWAAEVNFQPQVKVGPEFPVGQQIPIPHSTALLAEYLRAVYNWGIGAVGIVAALAIVIGGLIWLTAGGNMSRVSEAKTWIASALLGLVLALGAYAVLKTINPALVNFKITNIKSISGPELPEIKAPHPENIIGCCLKNGDWATCQDTIQTNCPADSTFYWDQKCDQTRCRPKTDKEIACAGKGEFDPCRTNLISQGYCDKAYNGQCVECKEIGESCNDDKVCCSGNCQVWPTRVCGGSASKQVDCSYKEALDTIQKCERITEKDCTDRGGEICEYGCEGYGNGHDCQD